MDSVRDRHGQGRIRHRNRTRQALADRGAVQAPEIVSL